MITITILSDTFLFINGEFDCFTKGLLKFSISENLRSGKVQNDGIFIGQFGMSRNSATYCENKIYIFGR